MEPAQAEMIAKNKADFVNVFDAEILPAVTTFLGDSWQTILGALGIGGIGALGLGTLTKTKRKGPTNV